MAIYMLGITGLICCSTNEQVEPSFCDLLPVNDTTNKARADLADFVLAIDCASNGWRQSPRGPERCYYTDYSGRETNMCEGLRSIDVYMYLIEADQINYVDSLPTSLYQHALMCEVQSLNSWCTLDTLIWFDQKYQRRWDDCLCWPQD